VHGAGQQRGWAVQPKRGNGTASKQKRKTESIEGEILSLLSQQTITQFVARVNERIPSSFSST
jgi:hypothetical protein